MLFTISLTENKQFLSLYKRGKTVGSKSCIFYYFQNKLPFNRLGITTSKKVGNAVCRNRARRVIRAAYQQNEVNFPIGYDFVIVAREAASQVKAGEISTFFKNKVIKDINKSKTVQISQKSNQVK